MGGLALVLSVWGLASLAPTAFASATTGDHGHRVGTESPGVQVTRTGKGPTGYQVTFRYRNASAASVSIKGTWSFSNAAKQASDPQNLYPILPEDWKPGDFPLQSPNAPSESWPVAKMTKDRAGLWTYTVPLPSGWFDYQLYPDCAATPPSTAGCTAIADPSNPTVTGCPDGTSDCTPSTYPWSEVYVPGDRRFGTEDLSWQTNANLPASRRGTVTNVAYPDPNSTSSAPGSPGTHNMVVYLPPGYDEDRATPYPVFVLSHGGGENELAWINRGRAAQILDTTLAAGKMQAAVVVMTNGGGLANPDGNSRGAYVNDVTNVVLPYVEQHYHVSTQSSGRAFAGTSAYGTQANIFMFGTAASGFTNPDTDRFGYYGAWSPAAGAPPITVTGQGPGPTAPQYQNDALTSLAGIDVAIGTYDLGGNAPMLTATTERQGLQNAGVPFRWFSVDGGHTWAFWRLALHDFLENMVFKTTTTSATLTGHSLSVSVSGVTTEPVAPTGTVTVYAGGQPVGATRRLHHGTAALPLTGLAGQSVTVVYHGDHYYTRSASTAVTAP